MADGSKEPEARREAGRPARFSLALRLYLLLVAISLPTFFAYYYYSLQLVGGLHEAEVDDMIRMGSFRLEDWLGPFPSLAELPQGDRIRLERELKRIADEPNGIESATVFEASRGVIPLRFVAAFGAFAPQSPTSDDLDALTTAEIRKVGMRRGEVSLLAVSVPLKQDAAVRAVIHLVLQPDKIGLGRRVTHLKAALILGAIGVMLVIGVGVVFFFQVSVNHPIRQLTDAMERASGGNLSALVDLRGGEFGWLAASYNQMMRRLKSSMDENSSLIEQIRGFNEELKAKIEGATHELAGKNVQLESANEKLFLLQGQLTTLEKLATLGQIAAIIAHELGTPLNAISGHLQLLLQDPAVDRRAVDRLRVIDEQVDRLTGIVRDVLKALRVPPPRLQTVDLRTVIRGVVDLIEPVAAKRGVRVEHGAEDGVPALQADPDQLQQVFMNLFTNAMDAMKSGGQLKIRAAASAAPGDEARRSGAPWIRVDVTDTGTGMDEETVKHAFEPFHTTKRAEAAVGGSARVGLGLAICRQIVLNHGGEISVRSGRGQGATFTLQLPSKPPADLAGGPSGRPM